MLSRPKAILGLALILAFVGLVAPPSASAAPLSAGVSPAAAAYGAQLTITGSGFGLAKPAVFLQSTLGKSKPGLKVLSFNDTTIVVLLNKKLLPGTWDVVVNPKAKGVANIVFASALSVRAPVFMGLDPAEALPGVTVSLHGQYLGTAKGSVKLGGKSAKVLSWTDTLASFVVPSKLKAGAYDLVVRNKMGSFTEGCALTVPGSGGSFANCPDRVMAQVGGNDFQASGFLSVFAFGVTGTPDQLIIVAQQLGPPRQQLQIAFPFDVTAPATANIVGDAHGFLRVEQGGGLFDPDTTVWTTSGQGDDYAVVVTSAAGGKITGTLSGLLVRTQGSAGDPTLLISGGTFRATAGP